MSEERATGRMRWMLVSHTTQDAKRPSRIKLQMEVETHEHGWAEDGTHKWWRDVPLVDADGNELHEHLRMPMWKID